MDHLHHFKLSDDPFRNEPLPGLFVETAPHREALCRLDRSVRQARGLSLLIAQPGAGKTIAVRQLFESLEEEMFEASMLVVLSPVADGNWLLRHFAELLGVEEPTGGRDELIAQVTDLLAIVRENGRHAVLIIDDAQSLASRGALDEVGALLKLEYEDRRLLSIVLAGDATLEAAVAETPTLAHRIDVKIRLAALDTEGTADYIAHRIRRASGDPAIIEAEALEALHELGRGLPGRLNTIADNALFEAFLCGRERIARVDIARAYADLEGNRESALGAEAVRAAPIPEITSDFIEIESAPPQVVEIPVERIGEADPPAAPVPGAGTPAATSAGRPVADAPADLDRELEAVFEDSTFLDDDDAQLLADPVIPTAAKAHAESPMKLTEAPVLFPGEGPPKDEADETDEFLWIDGSD